MMNINYLIERLKALVGELAKYETKNQIERPFADDFAWCIGKLESIKPTVKQLEWEKTSDYTWECNLGWEYYKDGKGCGDAIKGYTIFCSSAGSLKTFKYIIYINELEIERAETIEEAKAICQENYEQLILGGLE